MKRAYDDAALRQLTEHEHVVQVHGSPVSVRSSVQDLPFGDLDPWLVRRNDELSQRKRAVPKPSLRTLAKIVFRPETFLIEVRDNAEGVVLSGAGDSSIDLTLSPVNVTREEVKLAGNERLLWKYEPEQAAATPRPAFIHIHGGGFFTGRPLGPDNSLRFIANQAGAIVFDVDYSLSPEYKYPHAVNEVYAAIQHVRDNAIQHNIDPERIVVGGGSGGGNLTAAAALKAKAEGDPIMALQVLINAVVVGGRVRPAGLEWDPADFPLNTVRNPLLGKIDDPYVNRNLELMFKAYRGKASPREPYISPAMAADLADLPPALVLTAELDNLRPQAEFYAARLAKAGVAVRTVRYRGTVHETPGMLGYVPTAEAGLLEIVSAINKL